MTDAGGVFNELIGPANALDRGGDSLGGVEIHDDAAVAAFQDVIFQGDDQISFFSVFLMAGFVDGFREAGVDDGDIETLVAENIRRCDRDAVQLAETEQGNLLFAIFSKGADDLGLADFEEVRLILDGDTFGRPRG